jgi:hypothetical protein
MDNIQKLKDASEASGKACSRLIGGTPIERHQARQDMSIALSTIGRLVDCDPVEDDPERIIEELTIRVKTVFKILEAIEQHADELARNGEPGMKAFLDSL